MKYRRGFKTEANTIAQDVRADLHLGALARFDPMVLADDLGIEVISLSELAQDKPSVGYFLTSEQDVFSAVTVFCGNRRTIVHNDSHAWVRQKSNLAHELSHALLRHPPTPALDNTGCRLWNGEIEQEADWLASVLLVTEDAALAAVRRGLSVPDAATTYDVSVPMMQFRLNATGAVTRVNRARAARRR